MVRRAARRYKVNIAICGVWKKHTRTRPLGFEDGGTGIFEVFNADGMYSASQVNIAAAGTGTVPTVVIDVDSGLIGQIHLFAISRTR